MTLADAAQFLTSVLGSQLYLASLAVVLLVASVLCLLPQRRTQIPLRRRAASLSLLALRLGLIGLWWAATSITPELQAALPGVERFIAIVSALLFAWAFLAEAFPAITDSALAASLVVSGIGLIGTLIGTASLSPGESFNRGAADAIWTIAGLVLTSTSAAVLRSRLAAEPLPAAGMALLAVGFALHLVLGPAGEDFPPFLRVGELIAYPVLSTALLATIPKTSDAVRRPDIPPSTEPAPQVRPGVLMELVGLGLATDAQDLSRRLVRALSRAVGAEMCLLLTPPDEAGRFAIAGGYDLIQERAVEGASLDDRRSPVLGQALAHRRPASLPGRSRSPDMGALRGALNLRTAGPAVLAPLECDGRMYGGLVLLSPYSRQEWSEDQKQTLFGIAPLVARKLRQMEGDAPPISIPEPATEAESSLPDTAGGMPTEETLDELSDQTVEGVVAGAELSSEEPVSITQPRKTRMQSAIAGRPHPSESGQFQRVAYELQLALQELANVRAQLEDGNPEAQTADRPRAGQTPLRDEMVAIVRNLHQPISSGLGYADLLLGESVGLLGALQRKFLERVREGLQRAETQLGEIARSSAMEEELRLRLPPPISFESCLEHALIRTAGAVRGRGQSVRVEVPPDLPPVLVEENALKQILEHLLANASAVSHAGAEILLTAQTQPPDTPAFLHLSVADRGPGIPPAELRRVFGGGSTEETAAASEITEGDGDIAMVKALADAAGGRVWLETSLGEGSKVSVLLPLAAQGPLAEVPASP